MQAKSKEGPPYLQGEAGEWEKERVKVDEEVENGKCIHTLTDGRRPKDGVGSRPTPSSGGSFHSAFLFLLYEPLMNSNEKSK